nr:helix-turn-helix domain-containing protein [Pseudomonas fluorescens]
MIEHVLLSHQGNVTAAAKELGISRTTLYKRLALR